MIRFLLIACFAVTAFAQTTPVLVPVFYNGPGQFGSEWFTAVNISNFTTQRVEGHGLRFIDRTCAIPEGCERTTIEPGAFGSVAGPDLQSGFLLHIPAAQASQFELDARFGERTRNRYGVELPLARENDFRQAPGVVLPFVALRGFADGLRTTLRIYSPDAIAGQRVAVELGTWGTRNTIASMVVTLALSDPPGTAAPLRPAYAQLDLQQAFPAIFAGSVTVRVIPLPSEGGTTPRIWAFATAVRNDNNEVAVFSPR
jgi:hypothetical protein